MNNKTTKQVKKNPNPTGKGGFGDYPAHRNDGGRPRNPLKEYQREKFAKMSDKEKEAFLSQIDHYRIWTMAEGNPDTNTDVTSKGEMINTLDPKIVAVGKKYEEEIKKEL